MGRRRFPLSWRLCLAIFLTLAVPVGSLVGLSLYLQRAIRADANQKVNTTLDMAINMEESLLREGLVDMRQAAGAVAGDPAVAAGLSGQGAALDVNRFVQAFPRADIVLVVDKEGVVRARARSVRTGDRLLLDGLVAHAISVGEPLAFPALFGPAELEREGSAVHGLVDMPILKTVDSSDARVGTRVDSALALTGVVPVRASDGTVIGAAIVADILNRDFRIVDEVANWAPAITPMNATIAVNGVRVTTNVKLTDPDNNQYNERALGTIYSDAVMQSVAETGEYRGRTRVLGQWQRVIYRTVRDYEGQTVATAYVGTPEASFDAMVDDLSRSLWVASLVGGTALLIALIGALWMTYRGIVRPIRRLAGKLASGAPDVVQIYDGNDEIGDLVGVIQARLDRWQGTLSELEAATAQISAAGGVLADSIREAGAQSVRVRPAEGTPAAAAELRASAAGTVENLRRLAESIRAVGDGVRHEERSVLYMGRVAQEIANGLDQSRQSVEAAVEHAVSLTATARGALKQAGEFAAGLALLRQELQVTERPHAMDLLRDPSDLLTGMASLGERVAGEVRTLVLTIQENQARLGFIRDEMARVGSVVQNTAAVTREAAETADGAIGWMEGMAGNAIAVADGVLAAQSDLEGLAAAGRRLNDACGQIQEQAVRLRQALTALRPGAK